MGKCDVQLIYMYSWNYFSYDFKAASHTYVNLKIF